MATSAARKRRAAKSLERMRPPDSAPSRSISAPRKLSEDISLLSSSPRKPTSCGGGQRPSLRPRSAGPERSERGTRHGKISSSSSSSSSSPVVPGLSTPLRRQGFTSSNYGAHDWSSSSSSPPCTQQQPEPSTYADSLGGFVFPIATISTFGTRPSSSTLSAEGGTWPSNQECCPIHQEPLGKDEAAALEVSREAFWTYLSQHTENSNVGSCVVTQEEAERGSVQVVACIRGASTVAYVSSLHSNALVSSTSSSSSGPHNAFFSQDDDPKGLQPRARQAWLRQMLPLHEIEDMKEQCNGRSSVASVHWRTQSLTARSIYSIVEVLHTPSPAFAASSARQVLVSNPFNKSETHLFSYDSTFYDGHGSNVNKSHTNDGDAQGNPDGDHGNSPSIADGAAAEATTTTSMAMFPSMGAPLTVSKRKPMLVSHLPPPSQQQAVFEGVGYRQCCLAWGGFKGALLITGATGAGKTHIAIGGSQSSSCIDDVDGFARKGASTPTTARPGVAWRALDHIVDALRRSTEPHAISDHERIRRAGREFHQHACSCFVAVSSVDIHNEAIRDLLPPRPVRASAACSSPSAFPAPSTKVLRLQEDPSGGSRVEGLTKHRIDYLGYVDDVNRDENHDRRVKGADDRSCSTAVDCAAALMARLAATRRGTLHGSASSAVVTITVRRKIAKPMKAGRRSDGRSGHLMGHATARGHSRAAVRDAGVVEGVIHIVDLAGSERRPRTNSGKNIGNANRGKSGSVARSLTVLGRLISTLSSMGKGISGGDGGGGGSSSGGRGGGVKGEGSVSGSLREASAVITAARQTKLTRLLGDVLNSTAHLTLIATVSDEASHYSETLRTLRYDEHILKGKRPVVYELRD